MSNLCLRLPPTPPASTVYPAPPTHSPTPLPAHASSRPWPLHTLTPPPQHPDHHLHRGRRFESDAALPSLTHPFLNAPACPHSLTPLTPPYTHPSPPQPQIITYSAAADFESDAALASNLRAVASQFKGKLIFVTSSSESPSSEPIANYFGLKGAKTPVVSVG